MFHGGCGVLFRYGGSVCGELANERRAFRVADVIAIGIIVRNLSNKTGYCGTSRNYRWFAFG
jgi:hypothetical protein